LKIRWFPGWKWGAPKKIDFLTEKPLVPWGSRPKKIDFLIEKTAGFLGGNGVRPKKIEFFFQKRARLLFFIGGDRPKKKLK